MREPTVTSDGAPAPVRPLPPVCADLAFERAPIGMAHVAPDGRWLRVNPTLCDLLGYDEVELVGGMTIYDVTHPDDVERSSRHLDASMASGEAYQLGKRYLTRDGEVRHVRLSVSLLTGEDGNPACTLTHVLDRTAEVAALDEATTTIERYERLLATSADTTMVLDEQGRMIYVSANVGQHFGYPAERFLGRTFGGLMHPQDLDRVQGAFRRLVHQGGTMTASYRVRHADGSWQWMEATCVDRRDDPVIRGLVANVRNITDRVRVEDELAHQTMHDGLTGLPNRSALTSRVTSTIARVDEASTFALAIIDLDHFKRVNDSLGHEAGDGLLLEVADRMREQLRWCDTLARVGGDEFVVLLDHLDVATAEATASHLAERLLRTLAEPVQLRGHTIPVSASVGVAVHEPGRDVHDMLRDADVAMYEAKDRGRNQVAVHDERMRLLTEHRFRMNGIVRRALAEGGVVVEFQPIVELATQRMVGAESLVRLEVDGVRHLPGAFIEACEESGAIVPLGERVLNAALAAAAGWPAATYVAVNLSARQLSAPSLDETVLEALTRHGVAPERLVIEVTETALVTDSEAIASSVARLHEAGVRFALDDFGTGWSTFDYLRTFPVSIVKIDRSFTANVARIGGSDVEVIRAVLSLAAALGIDVVAEGVEEPLQAALLSDLGCSMAQGYLYGRPGPDPLARGSAELGDEGGEQAVDGVDLRLDVDLEAGVASSLRRDGADAGHDRGHDLARGQEVPHRRR